MFLIGPDKSFAEDEGQRVKGRRMTLSDINGNGLKWRPFNGTWINGKRKERMFCSTFFPGHFLALCFPFFFFVNNLSA